jgi:hypothetical protein
LNSEHLNLIFFRICTFKKSKSAKKKEEERNKKKEKRKNRNRAEKASWADQAAHTARGRVCGAR